jgi:hypothetical protein
MGTKLIVALIVVGLTVIICSSVFLASFFYDNFIFYYEHNNERNYQTGNHQPTTTPYVGFSTSSPVPILQPTNTTIPDSSKPNIITAGLNATDERSMTSYKLHISGLLNNTGGGTAYNAYLHVVACNKEGLAIDRNYQFGGMTGHVTLGLDFMIDYTGSPIDNCTITPIYFDYLQMQTHNPMSP